MQADLVADVERRDHREGDLLAADGDRAIGGRKLGEGPLAVLVVG